MAPPSTPDSWAPPSAHNNIVTIHVGVGKSKRTYRIHRGILAHLSVYFERALTGGFIEAETQEVILPDAEPEVFNIVQHWLYSQRLRVAIGKEPSELSTGLIARLWVFGDAHDIPALQNASIDLLHQNISNNWLVPTTELNYVYSNTIPRASLRRYLIDVIASISDRDAILRDTAVDRWCKESLWDLSKVLWSTNVLIEKDVFRDWDLCKYHVHAEGVRCANRAV